ncbi:MAG: hypothetical protein IKV57_05930 [Clostridia bacterium]|nr:hypothetical protein [Clostridia bacterium]
MDDKQIPVEEKRTGENLHKGHRQRMRLRYAEEGPDGFAPHEVLEMLLFSSIPRSNTNPIAHALLERYGSLEAVLQGTEPVPGAGQKTMEMLRETGRQLDSLFADSMKGGRVEKAGLYTAAVRSLRRNPEGVFLMVVSRDGLFQEMKTVTGYEPAALLKTLCPLLSPEQVCHIAFLDDDGEAAGLRKRFGKAGLGWILCLTRDWQPVWNL